jgi:hypothetical protein
VHGESFVRRAVVKFTKYVRMRGALSQLRFWPERTSGVLRLTRRPLALALQPSKPSPAPKPAHPHRFGRTSLGRHSP